MIILELNGNTITAIDKKDVIVKNSLRANEIFVVYENAFNYNASITFARSDGQTIEDLLMTPTTKTVNGVGKVGYYYLFADQSITAKAGQLSASIKVRNSANTTIIATATEQLVVSDSVVPSTTSVNITNAQYNSLLASISGLNQPLEIIPMQYCINANATMTYLRTNEKKGSFVAYDGRRIVLRTLNASNNEDIIVFLAYPIAVYKYNSESASYVLQFEIQDLGDIKNILDSSNANKDTIEHLLSYIMNDKASRNDANTYEGTNYFKGILSTKKVILGQLSSDTITIKGITKLVTSANVRSSNAYGFVLSNASNELGIATKDNVMSLIKNTIGSASQDASGFMSAEDKSRLDTLYALLGSEEDSDNVVNTINEVLAIFNNYQEGADLVTALSRKADKTTTDSHETRIGNLESGKADSSDLNGVADRVGTLENEERQHETRLGQIETNIANSQPLIVEGRVSVLERKVGSLEANFIEEESNAPIESGDMTVPSNAMKYGMVNSISGKTIKSENLLNISDVSATTTNGITYSISNGVITLNGTASGLVSISLCAYTTNGQYNISLFNNFVESGVKLKLDDDDNYETYEYSVNENNKSLTLSRYITSIILSISSGTTLSNAILKPMLIKGNQAPTIFKPYFSGLRHLLVDKFVSKGVNLWNEEWELGAISQDGNLVSSASRIRSKDFIKVNPSERYYGVNNGSGTLYVIYYDSNKNGINVYDDMTNRSVVVPSNAYYMKINPSGDYGTTYNHDIAIIKGTSGSYVTYEETTFLNNLLTSIKEYVESDSGGYNISLEGNIVDLQNKKAVIKFKEIDLSTLSWSEDSGICIATLNAKDEGKCIASNFETFTSYSSWNSATSGLVLVNGNSVRVKSTTTPSGKLVYELATPIEIDLSSIIENDFDTIVNLIPNGTLIAHNNYTDTGIQFNDDSYFSSFEITYQKKGVNY